MRIILASHSPRRKELLRKLLDEMGLTDQDFEIIGTDIDESRKKDEAPANFAKRLAMEKAQQVMEQIAQSSAAADRKVAKSLFIAADTIVVLGDKIYGKPKDKEDALNMLTELSGKIHEVITGFAILPLTPSSRRSFSEGESPPHPFISHDITNVTFKPLTSVQIQAYVDTAEPMDKAGAYAIQGGASEFIAKIEGSYTNVVGLPMEKIGVILSQMAL